MMIETMGLDCDEKPWREEPMLKRPVKRHESGWSLDAPHTLHLEARLTDIALEHFHEDRHWTQVDRRGQHPIKPEPAPAQQTPAMPLYPCEQSRSLGLELQHLWQPSVGVRARPCGVEMLTPPQPSGKKASPSMGEAAAAATKRSRNTIAMKSSGYNFLGGEEASGNLPSVF